MSLASLCSIHTVTVQKRSVSTGSAMQKDETWPNVGTMTCRVVPADATRIVEYGKRGQSITAELFTVTEPTANSNEYRFVFKGRILEFVGIKNPDELDRFWKIGVQEKSTHPDRS